MKKHGEEETLLGLDYTTKQLFWIFSAQVRCMVVDDEVLKKHLQFGHHPPNEARINGYVSNSAEFARDFNCPDGSAMISQNRCHLF